MVEVVSISRPQSEFLVFLTPSMLVFTKQERNGNNMGVSSVMQI